ncbi:hypothetical protein LTR36_008358 [Oleoguttula mirabilis]|uniref:Cytoplasmic tRNA 2-thiolation protein 2 n=1 Tax=Oleoguttula mirabilis TaxID=1507867 RepID=A0AAV9J7G6_9PEZI|nr:hypothetical protein LTR36_008358 [Oleoguttula mirabilis]
MPGRRAAPPIDHTLCRRCQVTEPAITVRTEPLCAGCFSKYVPTKIVKRMESFRVRHSDPGNERVLLLPLSFGSCSTALLHVLSQQLKGQAEKTGRTGFKLHVLHVDSSDAMAESSLLGKVQERYPEHTFSSCPLSDVLAVDGVRELFQADSSNSEPLNDDGSSRELTLEKLFASLTSPTSRGDILQILLRKLVVNCAKRESCEAILWGHSTTRLAERTLAETAKGRGSSLPWIVADGELLHGVPFYYPMRDLLSKEIASFTSFLEPPLDDVIATEAVKPAVSTKNTTIDDLMKQYFESVEQEYPSIVANVVKTTAKLRATPLHEVETQCELCDVPLDGQAPERSRLCYGCIRTLPQFAG